ncbi:hypothetical protein Tco_0370662 [Tanacetum coccineum]
MRTSPARPGEQEGREAPPKEGLHPGLYKYNPQRDGIIVDSQLILVIESVSFVVLWDYIPRLRDLCLWPGVNISRPADSAGRSTIVRNLVKVVAALSRTEDLSAMPRKTKFTMSTPSCDCQARPQWICQGLLQLMHLQSQASEYLFDRLRCALTMNAIYIASSLTTKTNTDTRQAAVSNSTHSRSIDGMRSRVVIVYSPRSEKEAGEERETWSMMLIKWNILRANTRTSAIGVLQDINQSNKSRAYGDAARFRFVGVPGRGKDYRPADLVVDNRSDLVKVVAALVVGQRTYRDARRPIYDVSVAGVCQAGHVDWPGSSSANETSIPKPSEYLFDRRLYLYGEFPSDRSRPVSLSFPRRLLTRGSIQ